MKNYLIGFVALLILIAGGWNLSSHTTTTADSIKIGFIGPLTGDAAAYGADTLGGATIAIGEINAAGGVNGKQLELVSEDGKCSAKEGLNAAQKLINVDQVRFIVASSCSGELLGYAPFAEQSEVIVISTLSSNPDVADAGDYIFRNNVSDDEGGKQLASLIGKEFKKVAVITEDASFPQGLRKVFANTFTKSGGSIVADEIYPPGSTDFRTLVLKIKAAKPDAIFVNPQAPAAGAGIAKQIRELGMQEQLYLVYMSGPEFAASGSAAEGAYVVDVPGLAVGKGDELLTKFKTKYGHEPGFPYYVGSTYDAVRLVADAIKKGGEDTGKAKSYFYGLSNYDGTIGRYHFDQKGELVGINMVVRKVVDQKAVVQ